MSRPLHGQRVDKGGPTTWATYIVPPSVSLSNCLNISFLISTENIPLINDWVIPRKVRHGREYSLCMTTTLSAYFLHRRKGLTWADTNSA